MHHGTRLRNNISAVSIRNFKRKRNFSPQITFREKKKKTVSKCFVRALREGRKKSYIII